MAVAFSSKNMASELKIPELIAQIDRPDRAEKLNLYLQSFQKRGQYCDTYYAWFADYLEPSKLMRERFGVRAGYRTEYEAVAVAFVANLHALIDSAPWFIYQAVEPLKYVKKGKDELITERACGWSNPFSQSLSPPYLSKVKAIFDEIRGNTDFKLLQKMSNKNKHSHMTRIKNNYTSLSFEVVDDSGKVTDVDCVEFFQRTHDNLVPRLMDLFIVLGGSCERRSF
jgi:hypothetical protein